MLFRDSKTIFNGLETKGTEAFELNNQPFHVSSGINFDQSAVIDARIRCRKEDFDHNL